MAPGKDLGARRLRWVVIAGSGLWALLAGRLVQVQAVGHEAYSQKAKVQHERQIPLSARRGAILDRHGRELAMDVSSVSFYCRPALVENRATVAAHFAQFGHRTPADVLHLLDSRRPFVYLLRQAHGEELDGVRRHRFEGVNEQEEARRYHPYGSLACQLLGFTDVDNDGREGVEQAFDEALAERPGMALSRVDSRGHILPGRSEAREPARPGASVRLTVDAVIQGILEEELLRVMSDSRSESAQGIITDPRTGDILAMASVPLFDPNDPGASPAGNRRNRAVTDPFEPGSTFKPITMAAVLETGVASPDTRVYCEQGAFALATGDTIRDVEDHGWLTASEVMIHSSNIGTIKLARGLQRHQLYEYLRSFGLGTRTGLGLPAESGGLLRHARDWSLRSLETIAIGQEVSLTAVQLAQAYGAIANDGVMMALRLVSEVRGADGNLLQEAKPEAIRRVLSAQTAGALKQMLVGVVREGTGKRAAIDGVVAAGKTGTAQRVRAGSGAYAADEYMSSFIGFLPADGEPRYVCLIAVDNPRQGRYGGTVAAPGFQRTMARVLALEGPPTPPAVPAPAVAEASEPGDGPVREDAIPDLRGLSAPMARLHAARRGLTLTLEGSGPLVVAQSPAPRTSRPATSDAVVCRLGAEPDIAAAPPAGTPLRQAVLLRKIAPQGQLAALAP